MPKPHRTHFFTALATFFALAVLTAITAPLASASISDSEELTRFGSEGSAAGQLALPSGVAADPITGHVYVVDTNNHVSEFTPWGNFVKAFGWDVAPGAVNERQEVRVRAASGQFNLSFGGPTTPDLPFNAPGSESEGSGSVEAALNALPSIGGAGASVSVEAVPGNPNGETPFIYAIAFKGSLAATDVAQIVASEGATTLSGGDPSTTLEARTLADGTPGGTGLESCTTESDCKVGLAGGGAGELNDARGIAVDAAGDIYVKEVGSLRVQKFDSAGRFILMFGGKVNKTKVEALAPEAEQNRCTAASGDECVAGTAGTGNGQFGNGPNKGIVVGPPGQIFVADNERFQRFNLQGEFEAAVPVPDMPQIYALAFDPISGDLYAANSTAVVRKLDSSTGAEVGQLVGNNAVAADSTGDVFTSGTNPKNNEVNMVLEYDAGGKPLSPASCCEAEPVPPPNPKGNFRIENLTTNAVGTLYVAYASPSIDSFIRSFGPGPTMFEAPPKVPPSIEAQYAKSVERDAAVLGADINPHFFTDTRYYVQYGTGKCSEGGCEATKPVPPGALLGSNPVDRSVRSAGIFLEGLNPETTYHYRFVAVSTGGGPVRGIGGTVGSDGEESTFTTYPDKASLKADCPNQQFRIGFSAPLTDCRAFEMVSPIDKNNGDIMVPTAFSLNQSSTDGDKFTYASYRAFADPQSAPNVNQYLAARQAGVGWASEAIAPPHGPANHQGDLTGVIGALSSEYKAFSPDLCQSWLSFAAEAPVAPPSTENYFNIFHRDDCGSGGYAALIGVEPQLEENPQAPFFPELQGTSADGAEAIFQVRGGLTPEAANNTYQAYYASQGALHLVCILPAGGPSAGNCSGGTSGERQGSGGPSRDRFASLTHAISADGNRVYWTAPIPNAAPNTANAGKVYLRENPGQEQSEVNGGECTEVEKACTLKVSETVSAKASRFLTASRDGSKALFEIVEGTNAGNLYEFDREVGESTLIAKKVGRPPFGGFETGLVGASEDLSRIYLVSEEALAEGATAGKENLYLAEEGTTNFIATLSSTDVNDALPNNISPKPSFHASRVSPDGQHLAFISTERLSDYDNTGQATGEADSEVYLYEAGAPGALCVSCSPSGARPKGRMVQGPENSSSSLATAASLPLPRTQLYASHPLSADGQRLFFNSYDALLPRDTNGKGDVYEWEVASGSKDCEKAGAEVYVPGTQGCLSLISSGESPDDSEFLDASAGGRDVFFTTNASLLPQDPGLIDVYDAREGGGLPPPPPSPEPCQGDACQNASPPPNDPTPASASFKGAGNLKPTPRCRKGRVARKGRCVAKKHKRAVKKHAAKRTNNNRRASR